LDKAYVFYPDASVDLCTAALLVEIDPVAPVLASLAFQNELHVECLPT
jgi:hypothetical protein